MIFARTCLTGVITPRVKVSGKKFAAEVASLPLGARKHMSQQKSDS
jgi:hypothetical protein